MPPAAVQFTPPTTTLPSLDDGVLFVFYGIVAIYAIFTAILYYHWQQYGTDARVNWITGVVYLGTTIPLVVIMSILALTL